MKLTVDSVDYDIVWQDRRDIHGSTIEVVIEKDGVLDEVMIIFCADYTSDLFLDVFHKNVPIAVVEAAIEKAKRELPEPANGWDGENVPPGEKYD